MNPITYSKLNKFYMESPFLRALVRSYYALAEMHKIDAKMKDPYSFNKFKRITERV